MAQFFTDAKLNSFAFVQAAAEPHAAGNNAGATVNAVAAERRDGMIMRDDVLEDLVSGPGHDLSEMALLGCRPGSVTLQGVASCLKKLPNLEHLAFSYGKESSATANSSEDAQAFLSSLPSSLRTLKLSFPRSIANQYTLAPSLSPSSESATLIDDLAKRIFADRQIPGLTQVCIHVDGDSEECNLQTRWKGIAARTGIEVCLTDWTEKEEAGL